jgi:hypothetical protein
VRVSVCFTVEVPTNSFSAVEEACVAAGRKAAREALVQALHRLEAARGPKARKARHGRRRTLLTTVGYVTIIRGRARRADGSRYFPLDERLGLAPHHEASPAVRGRGCELAAEHPYREAARLLSHEVGATVDHRALHRWVQADGDERLRARAERVDALFQDGEAPPEPPQGVREHLTVACDATGIRLVDGSLHSVKVGVAFTASEQLGATAKRRLHDRMVYADLAEVDAFGQALAFELEARYGLHRVPRVMLLGDGEPWIAGLGEDWLPGARYQCDWWHVGAKVREFLRKDLPRFPRWRSRAFRRPAGLVRDLRAGRHGGDPEEARLLAAYLENNAPHLYTFTRMGPGHWLHGSGPVEKHVELTVNRRFKRRGMRWSRRGARNLLAIRLEVIATR